MTDLLRLAEKIGKIVGLNPETLDIDAVSLAEIESLLSEAIKIDAEHEWKLGQLAGRHEAYTRAAEVARMHRTIAGGAIAAAIERLREDIP